MKNILLSVIMPIYNAEKFLPDALNSVLSQTLTNIEVICVNDGSTDDSLKILHAFAEKDSRVRVIDQKNSGSGAARNAALRAANGEYIAFLDADDWYPSETALEKLYSAAKKNNAAVCGGSLSRVRDGADVFDQNYIFRQPGLINYHDSQRDWFYQCFIFQTKMLRQNNIFFPHYRRYQDPPFFVKAMICAKEFYAIKESVYCHRETTGYKIATVEQTTDMLYGFADVLKLASKHNLDRLYKRTADMIATNPSITLHLKDSNNKAFISALAKARKAAESINNKSGPTLKEKLWKMLHKFPWLFNLCRKIYRLVR